MRDFCGHEGHGSMFKTTNMAQKSIGTSEVRLEDKDKIINFQQKLIVFLIKVIVLISFFGFLTIRT